MCEGGKFSSSLGPLRALKRADLPLKRLAIRHPLARPPTPPTPERSMSEQDRIPNLDHNPQQGRLQHHSGRRSGLVSTVAQGSSLMEEGIRLGRQS